MTESPCKPTNVSVSAPVVLLVAIWGWSSLDTICWPRASQHLRNSSPGLQHDEDWFVLKASQLPLEPSQRPGDWLESLLRVPWCPRVTPSLDAGRPPHLDIIRDTSLRLRISTTVVLYLARTSPVSLNTYNGVELRSTPMHIPCLVREEFAITLTIRLRCPSLIAGEITGRDVRSYI